VSAAVDVEVRSPLPGTVVAIAAGPGSVVRPGSEVVVVESMKVHHSVPAGVGGAVAAVHCAVGDLVEAGALLASISPAEAAVDDGMAEPETAPASPGTRSDLDAVVARHEGLLDASRPAAVDRRRQSGQRTARENVDAILDPGTFVEYGPLAIAAQRNRKTVEELIETTPADGVLTGTGKIDGRPVAVAVYDYTVLAGTQGVQGHRKQDRIFNIAEQRRLPVVLFAEGGGGRPGDQDRLSPTGLDEPTFGIFGRLSGLVPLVGVTSGFCFAGNAALLACCDVIIATEGSNIGMGGPAMVEGGGLGRHQPTAIGPVDVQVANGTVDLLVADEVEAAAVARRYLSYFGPARADWECADQAALRDAVPEDRRRAFSVRAVMETVCDTGSVLELRPAFGRGMVTALTRIEGQSIGILANDSSHLGGAIDADACDKGARFLGLCDAFDIPVVFLCDTPGFMVGPDAEERALVRHVGRLFLAGANLTVPHGTVVLRKGYGLGAMAMGGGGFRSGLFSVSWPTGEFGGMNLEGAVRLGYRRELDAIADPDERDAFAATKLAGMIDRGKALNAATYFEFDDAIDPADTRRWIAAAFTNAPDPGPRQTKKRPYADTW
jgi:acetyl-CoA carboxylase carboxyltransferase component